VADFKLTAQPRAVTGKKVSKIRRSGFVPGTIYGPKLNSVSVQFPYRELEVALMKAGGTNIINIAIDGGSTYPVLARDVQRDIIRGDILHVDFFAPDMANKVRAEIPINLTGESPLVAARKAILLSGINSLTVEVLPRDLMNEIEVDLTELKEIGDTITVGDLKIPGDVDIINDPEEMLAKIVQPAAARAEADLEALGQGEEGAEEAEAEEAEAEGEE